MRILDGARGIAGWLKKNWAVCLMILAGLVLLLLPASCSGDPGEAAAPAATASPDPVRETEARLSAMLSRLEGAGRVEVLLAAETGEEQVLARNEDVTERDGESSRREETVLMNRSGSEEAVAYLVRAPVYRGAVILAEGAGNGSVELALTRAVAAATGLSADRITVIKMREA